MKKHEKKSNGIEEVGSSGSGVCEKVGKHKEVECKICLKTVTSNNLKRHMKMHENKPCSIDVITEDDSTIDVVSLKNNTKDRWIILKISKDLSKLTKITRESSMVKNKKKKKNESDDDDDDNI